MSSDHRPWWHGPTPEESEKLDAASAGVRAAVASLVRALADDLERLARWVRHDQEQT